MASSEHAETSSALSAVINRDLLAADFLVSTFWSAMMSFRHDTVLRPFPPAFVDEQGSINTGSHKNILELVRPPVPRLLNLGTRLVYRSTAVFHNEIMCMICMHTGILFQRYSFIK